MDNKLAAKTAEALFGHELFPLPRAEEKTYTATELGDIFGVTANKIGRITNDFNLKTREYGEWYREKSKHSGKEMDAFKYYDTIFARLKEIIPT